MTWVTKTALLLLGLVTFVEADIFNKKFLVRVEDMLGRMEEITNTNRELSKTNIECNKTVLEQKQMLADLNTMIADINNTMQNQTAAIQDLQSRNAEQDATIWNLEATTEALNSTLSLMQNMQKGELDTFNVL